MHIKNRIFITVFSKKKKKKTDMEPVSHGIQTGDFNFSYFIYGLLQTTVSGGSGGGRFQT